MAWNDRAWRGLLAAAVAGLASTGCLLYTDPINVAPTVTIDDPPQPLLRGALLTFNAHPGDDGPLSSLRYFWGLVGGRCPDDGSIPVGRDLIDSGADLSFMRPLPNDTGDYCVFVQVTDKYGATGYGTKSFHLEDQPPEAVITEVTGAGSGWTFPLYSNLHFSSAGSTDPDDPGDTLTYVWTLTGSPGSDPVACSTAPHDYCFTVLKPGSYPLTLTVTDGGHKMTVETETIVVSTDQAPCIVDTDPPLPPSATLAIPQDPAQPMTFTVTQVDDDGDPWPPPAGRSSMATFHWSYRVGSTGDFTTRVTELPTFEIPGGTYQTGQTVQVRVEADDRRLDQGLATCDVMSIDAAVCGSRAGCNQWVTWTVAFR